jgi:hypothetical protein
MSKDIKRIETVAQALVIIKQLQTICKEQREEINGLKALMEVAANKSKSESAADLIAKHLFKK